MAETTEPAETAQKFFRYFQHEITALQQQMDRLGDTSLVGGERIDATEHCADGILRLSKEVKDANVYLPAYDQRTYAQAVKALQDRLEQTKSKFAPKQKFSFKTSRKNNSAISLSDAAHLASTKHPNVPNYGSEQPSSNEASEPITPDHLHTPANEEEDEVADLPESEGPDTQAGRPGNIRRPSLSASTSVSITNQKGTHIILPSSAGHATTTGTLMSLRRCIVDMSVPTVSGRPFAGLTLKNIKESLIICGHVSGPAHVTNLTDCIVVVACRQFRMHDCRRCDVYLQVASRPIVEGVGAVRFAPLPSVHASESERHIENMWDKVDDFKWLKNEQSPNWSTLPQYERITEDTWRHYVPGAHDHGLEDIFSRVGIPKQGSSALGIKDERLLS